MSLPHCNGAVCSTRTWRLACGCRCKVCKETQDILTKAATLPHCDGLRCTLRMNARFELPDDYPAFPACSCGCERCHIIAVMSGVRPASAPVAPEPEAAPVDFIDLDDEPSPADQALDAKVSALFDDGIPDESEVDALFVDLEDDDEGGGLESAPDVVASPPAHCGSPLCTKRAKGQAETGACGCGCPPCDEIAVGLGIRVASRTAKPQAIVVSAAGASPKHPLRERAEQHVAAVAGLVSAASLVTGPLVTGSKCGLLPQCLYWVRPDAERDPDETSEDAAVGTVGHTFAEEYAKGVMTVAREAELEEEVPAKRRDVWLVCMQHVRRWLDAHPRRMFDSTEKAIAWDPEADLGMDLTKYLQAQGAEEHRAYSHPEVWQRLRDEALLGPLTIPATLDLVRLEDGRVFLYDWCFGRTDKRAQLTLGALALASIHHVDEVTTVALYVSEEGIREVERTLDRAALDAEAADTLALLQAAPSSAPLPGMHCLAEYCPARANCPVTQEAIETVEHPALAVGHRFSPVVTGMDHAQWMLPRFRLLEDAVKQVEAALKAFSDKHGGIPTSPGKVWRRVPRKGSVSFSRAHAEALLRVKGCIDEEIGGCYVQKPESQSYREVNIPKAASR